MQCRIACVKKDWSAIREDGCAARKDSVHIIDGVGDESRRQVLPKHQVPARQIEQILNLGSSIEGLMMFDGKTSSAEAQASAHSRLPIPKWL